ncbi:MAG: transcriptional regulator [Bacteroidetes bacterium]|nr:MAG: transcriptional regulator [Bacteroidota bacterium]
MKITAQEEYGLRLLLRIARCKDPQGMSIPQLSEAEGLSTPYVAKLTRLLRLGGFINSTPGNKGGYMLAKSAEQININQLLKALGGALFDSSFCGSHSGSMRLCTNSVDCSVRSLWQIIQFSVDKVLDTISLQDLISKDKESENVLQQIYNKINVEALVADALK